MKQQKVGPKMGANKVVAGNTIEQLIDTIERLNDKNIAVTVDNLGEFVGTVEEATQAKNEILEVMQAIKDYNVDAHMSVKLSSLGGEFDTELAYNNLERFYLKPTNLIICILISTLKNMTVYSKLLKC